MAKIWKYMQDNSVRFCRPVRLGEILRAPDAVYDRVTRCWERAGKDAEHRFVPVYDEQGGDILGYIDALGKFVQMQQ